MQNEIKNFNDKLYSEKKFTKKVGNYLIGEEIGKGSFSKVIKGKHTITDETVAIKILDKSKIKDDIDVKHIPKEIDILKSIYHHNIAQLYEIISTSNNFYLIMEYIDGGDLSEFISENFALSENLACRFFRQLISVIEYLNDMGITHRDIKLENILLDSSKKNIKVIDFGLSNYCANTELLSSDCGSPCFASPEMIMGNSYRGVTTDLWSSGIVLYSMLVGELPFNDLDINILYKRIKLGTFNIPSNLSLESIDLLKKILQVNPDKRITIKEIKKHKWFNLENNVMYKGYDLTVEKFPCNDKIVDYVIKKFFNHDNEINKNKFIEMIQYNACNKYTTTYYLIGKYLEKHKNYKSDKNKLIIEKSNIKNENRIVNEKQLISKDYKLNNNEVLEKKNNFGNEKKNFINNKFESLKSKKKGNVVSGNLKIIKNNLMNDNIKNYFSFKKNKKKLSYQTNSNYHYLNDNKITKNNSIDKKSKSWSRKISKKYPKKLNNRNNCIINKMFYQHSHKKQTFNYQTVKPSNNNLIENYNKNKNSLKDNFKSFMKKKKLFFFNSQNSSKKNIFANRYKSLNTTDKNNSRNYRNLSKYNDNKSENKEKKFSSIREKLHELSLNKLKKKLCIKPNVNIINNELSEPDNYYYLTIKNNNKIKFPKEKYSSILLKQNNLENKNMKNKKIYKSNNIYKKLIDEYSTENIKNRKKLVNNESTKQNIIESNKNEHKYAKLIHLSHNKSLTTDTKMLNNKNNNNIPKKSGKSLLKNKINLDIKNEKKRQKNKYGNKTKIFNLRKIDNNNNNKISTLFVNKFKKNTIKEKLQNNNINYTTYINTDRINSNRKITNSHADEILSLSPLNNINNNRTTDNNKIINISIKKTLKIKKQYSFNRKKTKIDSSKNIKNKNNNKEIKGGNNFIKIKNYFSNIYL